MDVTEQDQTDEVDLGSAVEIRDPSLSSTSDSSGNYSDSDHGESTEFPHARGEEQPNAQSEEDQRVMDLDQPGQERLRALDKKIKKVSNMNKKG